MIISWYVDISYKTLFNNIINVFYHVVFHNNKYIYIYILKEAFIKYEPKINFNDI